MHPGSHVERGDQSDLAAPDMKWARIPYGFYIVLKCNTYDRLKAPSKVAILFILVLCRIYSPLAVVPFSPCTSASSLKYTYQ
jgi:hypothetical protein